MNIETLDPSVGYTPSEISDETTLTETSVDLIKDAIRMQFEDPSNEAKADFVSTFITRYHLTEKEIADDFDQDEVNALHSIHRGFISFMEDILKKKLKIGIVELDDMSEEEQDQMVHYLYRFFIINISQNMFNFLYRYIEKNKGALAIILPHKKTVSSRRMSEIMDDQDMITICSNLSDVVKLALTDSNITVDVFFAFCEDTEHSLEREFIMTQYENFAVTGNFVNRYRKMLPEWSIVALENSLLTKLVNKYKKSTD